MCVLVWITLRKFATVDALRWLKPDVEDKYIDRSAPHRDRALGLLSACAVAFPLKAGLVLLGLFPMRCGSVRP